MTRKKIRSTIVEVFGKRLSDKGLWGVMIALAVELA
jgi:hypothetical protein